MLLEDEADDRHDRERDRGRNLCDLAPYRPNEMACRRDNDHGRRERDENGAVPQIAVCDVVLVAVRRDAPRELVGEQHPRRRERQSKQQRSARRDRHPVTVTRSRRLVHTRSSRADGLHGTMRRCSASAN